MVGTQNKISFTAAKPQQFMPRGLSLKLTSGADGSTKAAKLVLCHLNGLPKPKLTVVVRSERNSPEVRKTETKGNLTNSLPFGLSSLPSRGPSLTFLSYPSFFAPLLSSHRPSVRPSPAAREPAPWPAARWPAPSSASWRSRLRHFEEALPGRKPSGRVRKGHRGHGLCAYMIHRFSIYIYIHMHTYTYIISIYIYMSMCMCVTMCVFVCLCVCVYTPLCTFAAVKPGRINDVTMCTRVYG